MVRSKTINADKKAGKRQSGSCVQTSETSLWSLAVLLPRLLYLFIYYLSIHLLSIYQPTAKAAKHNPHSPCLYFNQLVFLFPHIFHSCIAHPVLGLFSSFSFLSSLIHHLPPSSLHFHPSIFPSSSIFFYISYSPIHPYRSYSFICTSN